MEDLSVGDGGVLFTSLSVDTFSGSKGVLLIARAGGERLQVEPMHERN